MRDYCWDLETFLNCFLFIGGFTDQEHPDVFEISDRRNDRDALLAHLSYLQNARVEMTGFNNIGFDYEILHELLMKPWEFNSNKAYLKAQQIFSHQNERFGYQVPPSDRLIPQIDLYKICHFDNRAKTTSLKALQFAMRSDSVEDLPFDPNIPLNGEQMDLLRSYGAHDWFETVKFREKCEQQIAIRRTLLESGVLRGDVLNYSDVKIGTEYLINKIGRTKCFEKGSTPRQTPRSHVNFKDVILPKIQFRTGEFQAVHDWFKLQTVWLTKEKEDEPKPSLTARLAGIDFDFGVGGVHASVASKVFESNATHVIKDIDVSGMYPNLSTANSFYPEHLGQDFVTAYRQVQKDRSLHAKGSPMNATLKLAGNGVYGNSNNKWSCFLDPKYTFSVTVNGQLQLLQLVEVLSLIPRLELIQANTDGITASVPREHLAFFDMWCRWWENQTALKLEEVEYKRVWIRDVNNFCMEKLDGSTKLKGAYWYPKSEVEYDGAWNKDFSNMAAQKGIEQVLVNGMNPLDACHMITNKFDFMLRYKTPFGAKVYIGNNEMSKTVRYYVSTSGEPMIKRSTPKGKIGDYKRKNSLTDGEFNRILAEIPAGSHDPRIHTKNKSRYETVETSIESGWKVKCCNKASDFNWDDVDYRYYVEQIEKLRIGET